VVFLIVWNLVTVLASIDEFLKVSITAFLKIVTSPFFGNTLASATAIKGTFLQEIMYFLILYFAPGA
jgi:hypothetical protein